jgi:hypothetical protein
MKFTRLSITLYLSLIFLSGIAVGAFGHRLYTVSSVSAKAPNPQEWRKRYMQEMQTRLKLRPEQVSNLSGILDETRTRFHEARESFRPQLDSIRQQQVGKVRAMLNDDQRAEYDKMRQEREAREKAEGHKDGPGI